MIKTYSIILLRFKNNGNLFYSRNEVKIIIVHTDYITINRVLVYGFHSPFI